jgi:hypothetical protein
MIDLVTSFRTMEFVTLVDTIDSNRTYEYVK